MEAKLEFIRQGLTGPIWGLIDKEGLIVRQYSAKTSNEAIEFFIDQSNSLKSEDGINCIIFDGHKITL